MPLWVDDPRVPTLFAPCTWVCASQGSAEAVGCRARSRGSGLLVFIKGNFLLVPVESGLDPLPPGTAAPLLVFQPLLSACQLTDLFTTLARKLLFSGTCSVGMGKDQTETSLFVHENSPFSQLPLTKRS